MVNAWYTYVLFSYWSMLKADHPISGHTTLENTCKFHNSTLDSHCTCPLSIEDQLEMG